MVTSPIRRKAPHVAVSNGQPTTTSRDIAETFGKRHDDVLKRIRALDCSAEFHLRNFAEASYEVPQPKGGSTMYTEYRITRDGFAFLCMGFTGARAAQWKERYIATFNKLAERVARPTRARAARTRRLAPPVQAASTPATAPGMDIHALLLSGQSEPMALPAEIEAAIDQRAWTLAHEAYALVREHLRRRVPYHHVTGFAVKQIFIESELEDINTLTLGQALAHLALWEMNYALDGARLAARCAQGAAERIEEQMATLTQQHKGKPV